MAEAAPHDDYVIRVRNLVNAFGSQVIHDGVDLDVKRGEVIGIVGGSGAGKSVMLRTVVGLNRPVSGSIEVLGHDVLHLNDEERHELETHWGVLFQDGALFSSLTVAQNIEVPLKEDLRLPVRLMAEIAATQDRHGRAAGRRGGQISLAAFGRHAQARRACPGAGARPRHPLSRRADRRARPDRRRGFRSAASRICSASLGLTVFLVTHDLDSLFAICDRVAVLVDKKIKVGTLEEHLRDDHPWIHSYFHGPRGRAAHAARRGAAARG